MSIAVNLAFDTDEELENLCDAIQMASTYMDAGLHRTLLADFSARLKAACQATPENKPKMLFALSIHGLAAAGVPVYRNPSSIICRDKAGKLEVVDLKVDYVYGSYLDIKANVHERLDAFDRILSLADPESLKDLPNYEFPIGTNLVFPELSRSEVVRCDMAQGGENGQVR